MTTHCFGRAFILGIVVTTLYAVSLGSHPVSLRGQALEALDQCELIRKQHQKCVLLAIAIPEDQEKYND